MIVDDVGNLDDQALPRPTTNKDGRVEPLQIPFRSSSDDNPSIYSADNENERLRGRLLPPAGLRYHSTSPAPPKSFRARCGSLWTANKGLVLVLVSQLFGALMNVTARLLETSGEPLNTFQVMFARMGITLIMSTAYMWWANIEHFPFGPKEVRKLLMARGFGGFFGHSLQYLPLADATVITFLAPIVTCWACSILIHEPFTRAEQVAGLVSLLGIVLIARPTSFFSPEAGDSSAGRGTDGGVPVTNVNNTAPREGGDDVESTQRLIAVGVALIGVLGAASAYTTIRWIGQRAHPLISVNYFAAWVTFVATLVLLFVPGMHFKLPSGVKQWSYLVFLGVCGFAMQLLLTTGLAYEKSSRATNMVYTQMLFALAFDKLIFDTTPGILSILGSSLILGSALYIAVRQDPSKRGDRNRGTDEDGEDGLMGNGDIVETAISDE
ncbi:MAG: hypothetical protein Q9196_001358 [Gyalolechia fulgens]